MTTLYLDMDGVVADFDTYAERIIGKRSENNRWEHEDWQKLQNFQRIYRDLPKTPEADALVEYCRQFALVREHELLFLTAVPKGNDFHWAFYDKMTWAQEYYPDIPVHFGPFGLNKQVHCRAGDILIDDRLSNIEEWTRAGGIAIRHLGNLEDTIRQLEKL